MLNNEIPNDKFRVGDYVVGNELADIKYGVTKAGTQWAVYKINKPRTLSDGRVLKSMRIMKIDDYEHLKSQNRMESAAGYGVEVDAFELLVDSNSEAKHVLKGIHDI